MKRTLILVGLIVSQISYAETTPERCARTAEKAVKESVAMSVLSGRYDEDGIFAGDCNVAKNQKAMLCEVGAMKGDGAASDTYLVVMDLKCRKTFRVEMIGEE